MSGTFEVSTGEWVPAQEYRAINGERRILRLSTGLEIVGQWESLVPDPNYMDWFWKGATTDDVVTHVFTGPCPRPWRQPVRGVAGRYHHSNTRIQNA